MLQLLALLAVRPPHAPPAQHLTAPLTLPTASDFFPFLDVTRRPSNSIRPHSASHPLSATSSLITRFPPDGNAQPPETLAALVLLSPAEPDLSLSPHQLDATTPPHHLIADSCVVPEAAPEPLMMAQPVPHQTTDKRRVKVYELRHNDWFDRGTGFCYACFVPVCLPDMSSATRRQLGRSCVSRRPLADRWDSRVF